MPKGGQLRIRVVGDTSNLSKSLGKATSNIGAFAKKAAKIGAAATAAFGAAAVTGAFKVASFGDEIAKSAQKAGLGVEQFQELRFAFGQGGVEADTFNRAMLKFNKRLGESATTGGTADESFRALGISLKDANGNVRDSRKVIEEVLPKLAGIESNAERAAVAGDLFGQRAGPELASALNEGAGGIEAARKKAQELGVVMGEEAAAKAEKFTDTFDDLKQSALGLLRKGLTPVMGWMADDAMPFIQSQVIPRLKEFGKWLGPKLEAAASKVVAFFKGSALPAFQALSGWWESKGPAIQKAAKGVFDWLDSNARPIMIALAGVVAGVAVPAFAALATTVWASVAPFLAVAAPIAAAVGLFVLAYNKSTTFRRGVEGLMDAIGAFTRNVGQWISSFARGVTKAFEAVIGWFRSGGDQADATSGRMSRIWERLQAITDTVWTAISTAVETAMQAVSAVVETVGSAIRAFWQRWGDDLLGFASRTFDRILQAIDGVLKAIQGVLDVFIGVFTGDWQRAWDGVKQTFEGVWQALRAVFAQTLDALKTLGRVALTELGGIFKSAWDGILNRVSTALTSIATWFRELPGRLVNAAAALGTALVNHARSQMGMMFGGVREVGSSIAGWFSDLPDKLVRAMAMLGGRLGTFVRRQMNIVWDQIKDVGSSIISWFKDLPGNIVSALGNLGSKIKDKFTFSLPGINFSGDGPGMGAPDVGGKAAKRAAAAAEGLPIRKTSGYRTPAENRAAGGSPTSYHLVKDNPAVDYGGPTWALDMFAARLREMGGWRELLWRTAGHFGHVHVAHEGGMVTGGGMAPLPGEVIAKLQSGETVLPRGSSVGGGGDRIVVERGAVQVHGSLIHERDLVEQLGEQLTGEIRRKTGMRD